MARMKFQSGSPSVGDRDANILGNFIENHFQGKPFKPQELVDAARPKNSPIHKFFDWNDDSAGEKWRVHQARMYINLVIQPSEVGNIKSFHNVTIKDARRYMSTKEIVKQEDLWEQVVESAFRELTLWKARHQQYKEFKTICSEIERLEKVKPWQSKQNKNKSNSKKSTSENSRSL